MECSPLILLLLLAAFNLADSLPISLRSGNDVAGIWKLSSKVSFLSTTPSETAGDEAKDKEALLVLNSDGSFSPCKDNSGDGSVESSFILGGASHGQWHFDLGRKEVTLVPDRPGGADRSVHDLILHGTVATTTASTISKDDTENVAEKDNDTFLTIPDGMISIGRCMYPRNHANFFDAPGPIHRPTAVGTFQMAQVLGSLNTNLQSDGDIDEEYDGGGDDGVKSNEIDSIIYNEQDFFGRRFLLTVEPLPSRPAKEGILTKAAQMKEEEMKKQPLDVRVLPVEFHGNRTFTAVGVNKILRGRFHVKNESGKDMLKMDVSLFGAGRSAPGSVYSEGKGLTHEDERSYSGQIIADEEEADIYSQTLFVRGSVVFGTDLGSDARPEPVGVFSMMEIKGD